MRAGISFGVVLLVVGLIIGYGFGAAGVSSQTPQKMTATLTLTSVSVVDSGSQSSHDLVEYCFSPGGDCASVVVKYIDQANVSIHILIYSFTLNSIGDALLGAAQRNPQLDIRIVWDAGNVNGAGSEYQRLKAAGFNIRIDQRSGLLHDKVAIIDSHIIITGSFNWSSAANNTNRENLVVLDSASWAQAYEQNFEMNWASSTPS
jgi:phospholipase D